MDNLEAGGSTACGAGITPAYKVARKKVERGWRQTSVYKKTDTCNGLCLSV